MSTFEIVRGVEGDCLVLNDTRICGPKPWGGGRIIKTFRTDGVYEVIDKDEYRKLMAENAKLRELVADMGELLDVLTECDLACKHYHRGCIGDCYYVKARHEMGIEVS